MFDAQSATKIKTGCNFEAGQKELEPLGHKLEHVVTRRVKMSRDEA